VDNGSISSNAGELKFRIKSSEALDINGVALRLEEQISRGLVQEANGEYQLTPTGSIYVSMANFLADLYRLENWDINKD
jgi:predicted transcriptional regulator